MTYTNNKRSVIGGPGITVTTSPPGAGTGADVITISSSASGTTHYGSFYSTVTQTSAGTTAANKALFNTTVASNGVSVVSNSRITFANAGTYLVSTYAQLSITSGGPGIFNIWYAQNGTNIVGSNNVETIEGGGRSDILVNSFVVITVNPGEYVEIMWSTTSTNGQLEATGPQVNPTRPLAPSIVLTATQLS